MSRVFPARGSRAHGPTRRRSAAGHSRAGGAANSLDRRWCSWPPFPRTGGRRWRSRSPPSPRRRSHSRARGEQVRVQRVWEAVAPPSQRARGAAHGLTLDEYRSKAIPARGEPRGVAAPAQAPGVGHSRARGAADCVNAVHDLCGRPFPRAGSRDARLDRSPRLPRHSRARRGNGAVIGGAWRPEMSRRRARRLAFSTMPLRLIVKELSYGELFDVAMLHRIVKQFLIPPGGASWSWRRSNLIKLINSKYYVSTQGGEGGERKTFSQAPAGVRRKYLLRF